MTEFLIYLLPLLFAAMVVLVIFAVSKTLRASKGDDAFLSKLEEVNKSEFDEASTKKKNSLSDWFDYWYNLTIQTGVEPANKEAPGRTVIVAAIVALGFGSLVLPGDIFVGILMAGAVVVGWKIWLNFKISKRAKQLDKQLPTLLFNMRANLQSNYTPQQALLAVVDDLPAPLGTELAILRDEVNVNVPLQQALRNLAKRVPSREMKFLVSSIEIASVSGSDLDPQLRIIQQIIAQRARIASRLATAVASVQPSVWIAAVLIPGSLIFSFYSDPNNREFWTSFMGLVALGAIGVLYVAGILITRKLVKNIENS